VTDEPNDLEQPQEVELTEEEYEKLVNDLDKFEETFLSKLAESDKFEIVSTYNPEGKFYSKEQLTLIKKELLRLGVKILYRIDLNSSVYILFNPQTMKIGYVTEGIH